MRPAVLLFALLIAGCATSSGRGLADPFSKNPSQAGPPGEPGFVNAGASPIDAALMTGAAAGASVAQRRAGGCYANCPPGTACNRETGFCDELPCRGLCAYDEECLTDAVLAHCVKIHRSPMEVHEKAPVPPPAPAASDVPPL